MTLAIFDLDNTLLGGDSDFLWGRYLCENNIVDPEAYRHANEIYYEQYQQGKLDIYEFLDFVFKPLSSHPKEQLEQWRADYLQQKIEPIILPAAMQLVDQHRKAGDTLMIITATNSFLTAPIAQRFGITHLIATEPELKDGRYTGKVAGTPSFHQGKVERLNEWLTAHNASLEGSTFYSDSHNDIPLLELVETAIAVDPDPKLQSVADERGWKILSLRE